jgi:hypothetical protein
LIESPGQRQLDGTRGGTGGKGRRRGVSCARPRDRPACLSGQRPKRVVPIQVKARTATCYEFQRDWFGIPGLVLIQVWHVTKKPEFYIFGGIEDVVSALGPQHRLRGSNAARTMSRRREAISRGLSIGQSIRGIAADLRRAPSTVSRQAMHHGGRQTYRAHQADRRASDRALRPKRCSLRLNSELRRIVASKLCLDWSPEQISA